jgi:uncharacterized protein (UPF0276 family)
MLPAIGYAIREQNRPILDDPAINAAEITFERADDPLRIERYIHDMEFDHISVHALKLSVASPEPPGERYMKALKAIAMENGALSISDHLGFTRDGHHGVEMGHFAPPPYTEPAVEATVRNIDIIQNYFGDIRFYVENIAYLFQFEGTMSESEFLKKVLQQSGSGWVLDVTNVYANSVNFGYDPYEFIAEVMPHADRVQMHLAGGFYDERSKMYIDSHSHPIPAPVWDLYRHSLELGRGKVDAVFIERDQNFPDEAGWREEVRTTRQIAEEVHAEEIAKG